MSESDAKKTIGLRIKFSKHGAVRYIGHLDVMRFFQKCIRRAGIDVAYTTGFSPHQIMSFAAPLGVGLESNGEYMDIEVNSLTSCEDVVTRLNEASVPDIRILSATVLPKGAKNAMASVAAAAYTVCFREGKTPEFVKDAAVLDRKLPEFLAGERILITKEGKNGQREVDIRPGIYEFRRQEDAFFLLVDASSAGNVKPVQVMTAFCEFCGTTLPENALHIIREETYADIGEGESPRLVPLDQVTTK